MKLQYSQKFRLVAAEFMGVLHKILFCFKECVIRTRNTAFGIVSIQSILQTNAPLEF